MPASTGTDGRGGRLRAVQATASASTSRATRNFISRPTHVRSAHRTTRARAERWRELVVRRAPGPRGHRCVLIVPVAVPRGETPSLDGLLQPIDAVLRPSERSVPTQSVVREFSEITPSSSSSLVWKLGNEPLRAGQRANGPVGPLWAVSVFLLSTRGQIDGCAP